MCTHQTDGKLIQLNSDIHGKECSCGDIHPVDPRNYEEVLTNLALCQKCNGFKVIETVPGSASFNPHPCKCERSPYFVRN